MPATACRHAYDHRMRDLVCEPRDPGLFRHLGVPRSTAVSWIRRGPRPVLSAEVLTMEASELQAEVLALRYRIRFLLACLAGSPYATRTLSLRSPCAERGCRGTMTRLRIVLFRSA